MSPGPGAPLAAPDVAASAGSGDVLLEVSSVTKRFGPLVACRDVSFGVRRGEIMGLLGQNGAGKSTLMKIVVGVQDPDAGQVRVDGDPVPAGDPVAAAAAGIGMVHQHFSLVGRLAVWQNVVLGDHQPLDRRRAIEVVEQIGARYGLEVDPCARVDDLSAGMRQRVEIIKCLRGDPKVIILDEPTSVLTQPESVRLFEVLRSLVSDHGYAAVLISHRLSEILHATDSVTILRSGEVVASMPTAQTDAPSLANMMLGRDVALEAEAAALGLGEADEVFEAELSATAKDRGGALRIDSLVVRGDHGNNLLDGLSLEVASGEIVGLAGVEGNGQTSLVEVLSGLRRAQAGSVTIVDGAGGSCPADPRGLAVIPADRHDSGCVLDLSIAENLVMTDPQRVSRRGVLQSRALDEHARGLIADFDIHAVDPAAPMWTLSGGNQQKVVLARELSRSPQFIVAEQPTRGLDVGAMEYMWHCLRTAAAQGTGVLLLSTELDEILALSTRVAVIFRGQIIGTMGRDEVDIERLGLMMGGQDG